jgi:hypothetical protein
MMEKDEYEEDHHTEEVMFSQMDSLLTRFREYLVSPIGSHAASTSPSKGSSSTYAATATATAATSPTKPAVAQNDKALQDFQEMTKAISSQTRNLSQHLMAHLQKEELQCLPLVAKHLSREEIHELVGKIMGKRSADTIASILNRK